MSQTLLPTRTSGALVKIFPEAHDFFQEMESLSKAITERAFALFERRGGQDGHDLCDWLQAQSELCSAIPIEIAETEENFVIRAEVPGIDISGLEVDLDPSVLIIKGKTEHRKEQKEKQVIHSEFGTREILRRIDLPSPVDTEKTTAKLEKGVLELTLPKVVKATKVPIKAAA